MVFQNNSVTRIDFNDELLFQNEVFGFNCPSLYYIQLPEKSKVINAANGVEERYWNMATAFYYNGEQHLNLEAVTTQSGYLYASNLFGAFRNCANLDTVPIFKVKNDNGIQLQNCFYYVDGSLDINLDADSQITTASNFIGPSSTVSNVHLNINAGGNLDNFMNYATITGELVVNLRGSGSAYNCFPAAKKATIKIFNPDVNAWSLLPYSEYNSDSSKSFEIHGLKGSQAEHSIEMNSLFSLFSQDINNTVYQLKNNLNCFARFTQSVNDL